LLTGARQKVRDGTAFLEQSHAAPAVALILQRKIQMKLSLTSAVTILATVLFIASVGMFLLYVPLSTILAASIILLAMLVTFGLGVQAGGRRIRIKRHKDSLPAGPPV
jgi:hypothetical protein